jgi:spore coat protein U-like protein
MNPLEDEMSRVQKSGLLVLAALLSASPLRAAVTFTCTVSATGIAFGAYNPLNTTATTAAGSWTVTCNATGSGSATVSGTLSLSTGKSGTYTPRQMFSGTNALNYNIYLTPSYTMILGNGSGGTYAPSDSGTVTAGQVYQVSGNMYGMIPASQDVAAGSYSDLIVVTVAY